MEMQMLDEMLRESHYKSFPHIYQPLRAPAVPAMMNPAAAAMMNPAYINAYNPTSFQRYDDYLGLSQLLTNVKLADSHDDVFSDKAPSPPSQLSGTDLYNEFDRIFADSRAHSPHTVHSPSNYRSRSRISSYGSVGSACDSQTSVETPVNSSGRVPPSVQLARKLNAKRLCVFCKNNGEVESVYASHILKDDDGRVLCPILRAYTCPICGDSGDTAHTIKYCPQNTGQNSPSQDTTPTKQNQMSNCSSSMSAVNQHPPPPPTYASIPSSTFAAAASNPMSGNISGVTFANKVAMSQQQQHQSQQQSQQGAPITLGGSKVPTAAAAGIPRSLESMAVASSANHGAASMCPSVTIPPYNIMTSQHHAPQHHQILSSVSSHPQQIMSANISASKHPQLTHKF
ncbi:uncharacterized protein LOC142338365 [Convolutriloba macropyga]|uniref:uncharacterized protein LOC142338365 n=1 Tax=Convolutriloba macropyga TaxID=536237 RepID=UPI003F51CF0D